MADDVIITHEYRYTSFPRFIGKGIHPIHSKAAQRFFDENRFRSLGNCQARERHMVIWWRSDTNEVVYAGRSILRREKSDRFIPAAVTGWIDHGPCSF